MAGPGPNGPYYSNPKIDTVLGFISLVVCWPFIIIPPLWWLVTTLWHLLALHLGGTVNA